MALALNSFCRQHPRPGGSFGDSDKPEAVQAEGTAVYQRKRKQAGKIDKTEGNMLVERSGKSQGREQILLKGRHLGFYEGPPFSLGLGHRWAVFILGAYPELCSM